MLQSRDRDGWGCCEQQMDGFFKLRFSIRYFGIGDREDFAVYGTFQEFVHRFVGEHRGFIPWGLVRLEGGLVESAEVVWGDGAGSKGVADVDSCPFDEGFEVFGFDADGSESRRDADLLVEFAQPSNKGSCIGVVKPSSLSHARKAFRDGGSIELHARGDHQGVCEAVVHIADGGEGVSAGMGEAKTFLEGDSAHHRGFEHTFAGFDVTGVIGLAEGFALGDALGKMDARGKELRDEMDAFEGDAVAKRVVSFGEVGFDKVCESVDAGGCGDRCREGEGDFGIEQGERGQEARIEDDAFSVIFFIGDDGRSAYFAACSCGGGDGDDQGDGLIDRATVGDAIFVIKDIAGMMDHQRDHLGDVHRGSPPEGDHRVGLVSAECLDTSRHL